MNRKYNRKNIPKAWKKKKRDHRHKKKILLEKIQSGKKTSFQFFKKNKSIPYGKKSVRWKFPSMIGIGALIMIILIVPAMIAFPFGKQDHSQAVTVAGKSLPEVKETSEEVESPFSVEVMRSASDDIEDVPLETYVARVVASEMPADFELEALKAQALAARTYIVNHILYQEDDRDSDVSDTTEHQVYQNDEELRAQMKDEFHDKMAKIEEAVAATEGEIITYDDDIITPAYFSTSNGYTENAGDYWDDDIPYLRSVDSHWDKDSPKYLDQKVMTAEEVENALGVSVPNDDSFSITHTDSGRVEAIELGDETLSGREVREALELRSSDFSVEQKNDHFIFKTKGFGHGIGMSQYGANGMAEEGKSYKDIITHYYHDVTISQLSDTAPTLVAGKSKE